MATEPLAPDSAAALGEFLETPEYGYYHHQSRESRVERGVAGRERGREREREKEREGGREREREMEREHTHYTAPAPGTGGDTD